MEVLDYLGTVLVDLLGELMVSQMFYALEMLLKGVSLSVLKNVRGAGGAGVLRGPNGSNRFLPVISRFKIVLATLEISHTC